ncbi:hypothetical protein, partial [Nocardia abscessus]|uniref:hypothetical protein n=1 Tax=Nocardia abscessus TaxID=120957 RepID=UPI002454BBCA
VEGGPPHPRRREDTRGPDPIKARRVWTPPPPPPPTPTPQLTDGAVVDVPWQHHTGQALFDLWWRSAPL